VVAVVAAVGWTVLSPPGVTAQAVALTPATTLTGTVAAGQQELHPVHVDRAEALAIGADEATGQAVRLGLRTPDGTVQEVGADDLAPGPAVRGFRVDLPAGDYQLVVEGQGDGPTDYEVWVATGPELSATPGGGRYDGELSTAVAGPFLFPGTGATVQVTAHSAAFDTILTVSPLGDPEESTKLTNDDHGLTCLEPDDVSAIPGVPTPQGAPAPALTWSDSQLSVPTRRGEVYQVHVRPLSPGVDGPYSISTVEATERALSLGQPLSEDLAAQGATTFHLPDDAREVSVETTGGGALELTVNPGGQPRLTECISRIDLAGARLGLTPGSDRALLVQNLAQAPVPVVLTAR
jgi:hypothetical protein